jgi:hypothetical protein
VNRRHRNTGIAVGIAAFAAMPWLPWLGILLLALAVVYVWESM